MPLLLLLMVFVAVVLAKFLVDLFCDISDRISGALDIFPSPGRDKSFFLMMINHTVSLSPHSERIYTESIDSSNGLT